MKIDMTSLPVASRPPDERRFWRKLGRVLAHIPFAEDLVASWYCAKDRATPMRVRALLWGSLVYFVTPADLVPDYLIGLGFTDDAAVLAMVMSLLGHYVMPRHRAIAEAKLEALRAGD